MVAIKDMKMPKSCTECPMTHEDKQSRDLCEFTYLNVTYEVRKNLKHSDCPLVEIVTCKDCKYTRQNDDNDRYCDLNGRYYDPDYYCADAERRE